MTCYDCIHYDACSDAGDSGFSCLKEDVSKCKHFKNKDDFVDVVRCKDCKHYERFSIYDDDYYCMAEHTQRFFSPNKTDYCSYGERRDT